MDLAAVAETWEADGFVVLPEYLPAGDVHAAIRDLPLLFPTGDGFHDAVDPARNARFADDEFNGIDSSPSPAAL
ncbi:MAG TPA: hypothetical protein VJ819_11995 [Nocardioidaceae bacterium]|nr:hypothetical protein [Nocardioidaceae bacterium]